MKWRTGKRILSILLTLAMVMGLMPGMSVTARAADKSETIETKTDEKTSYSGEHFTVTGAECYEDYGLSAGKTGEITIGAVNGERITKIVAYPQTAMGVDRLRNSIKIWVPESSGYIVWDNDSEGFKLWNPEEETLSDWDSSSTSFSVDDGQGFEGEGDGVTTVTFNNVNAVATNLN